MPKPVQTLSSNVIVDPSRLSGVPNGPILGQVLARSSAPLLSGKIPDDTPGRGTDRPRLPGRCVDFDGTNDYAILPTLTMPANVTFSFRYNSSDTTNQVVFGDDHTTNYYCNISGSNLTFYVEWVARTTILPHNAADGNWHLVQFSLNGTALHTYFDGVLVGTFADTPYTGTIDFKVGRSTTVTSYYDGKLSDFQILSQAITPAEALAGYQSPENWLPGIQRLAWYKCDEQHPTLLLDSSGNKRHGTLSGHDATIGNFFYEGADVPVDYLNKKGFTLADGATYYANDDDTGLIASGVKIPRLESDKTKCAAFLAGGVQATLQYSGEAPAPGQLIDNNCLTLDGTNDKAAVDLSSLSKANNHSGRVRFKTDSTSGGTLFSTTLATDDRCLSVFASDILRIGQWNGSAWAAKSFAITDTAEWHILEWEYDSSGHSIAATLDGVSADGTDSPASSSTEASYIGARTDAAGYYNGSLCDFQVSIDGVTADWFPLSEGSGTIAHNAIPGGSHGTISGIDEAVAWVTKQNVFAYNGAKGHSKRINYCPSSNLESSWTKNVVTLTDGHSDPHGGNGAMRIIPSTLDSATHRIYRTAAGASSGRFLVVYYRAAVGTAHQNFVYLFTSGDAGYSRKLNGHSSSGNVLFEEIINGWVKVVFSITDAPSDTLQIACSAGTSTAYLPTNTTDGLDFFFAIVDDWETQDVYPTTGTAVTSSAIYPAKSDGSGNDVLGLTLTNPPRIGHNHSEASVDFKSGIDYPTRDWSLPDNLIAEIQDWSALSTSVTLGMQDPFGRNEAVKITPNTSSTIHGASYAITFQQGVTYTLAAIAKADGYGGVQLNRAGIHLASFNLETGEVNVVNNGGENGRIYDVGGGFYLCMVDMPWTAATSSSNIRTYIHSTPTFATGGLNTFAGDGVSGVIYSGVMFAVGSHDVYAPNDLTLLDPPRVFHPAPPELFKNTAFAGTVAGTPGTPPTNWTFSTQGGSLSIPTTGTVGFAVTASKHRIYQPVVVAIGDVLEITVDAAVTAGTAAIQDLAYVYSVTGTFEHFINGVGVSGGGVAFTSGTLKVRWTATAAGTANVYLGVGVVSDKTQSATFTNPSLKRYFPTNPTHSRQRTDNGVHVATDRITHYGQTLVGTRLDQVNKFIETEAV